MTTYILDGIWGSHSRWEILRGRIEKAIGPCRIWRYENSGCTSLETLGTGFREELRKVKSPINLIGYSMGGLVVREALRSAHDLDIRRTAFLHCPHGGSLVAHLLPLTACREMRPASNFLAQLNKEPWNFRTLATWCAWDAVVVPGCSARWSRAATQIRSPIPAHAWPVISPAIHRAVIRFLQ